MMVTASVGSIPIFLHSSISDNLSQNLWKSIYKGQGRRWHFICI